MHAEATTADNTTDRWRWRLSLFGLALFVFAAIALSSPGRIDVVDGHSRYEVGRSYVEHGDSVVRDADAWFAVFEGRNGQRYSAYRFPQSVVAAAAILVSDFTGPIAEPRRHFFFSLSGAILCAAMAVLYAGWFHSRGHRRLASLAWAAGGIFCTPTWFYGTTSYDDVLGSLIVLMSLVAAWRWRERRPLGAAIASGLLLGLAFNCKPPLALFMPLVLAALWETPRSKSERWLQARVVFFCAAIGVIGYQAYDLWKFPPSTWPALAEARRACIALWPGSPLAGLLGLLVSPGMGAIWYWPGLVLALYGLARWWNDPARRRMAAMAALSAAAYVAFIASIRFFSGEPAWGPRYLTPVFAVLWVFVPAGAVRLGWSKSLLLLAASFLIQVGGLSIDTIRFFSGQNAATANRFLEEPWCYFDLRRSHLLARPGQIWDVLRFQGPAEPTFSPATKPTLPWYAFVVGASGTDPATPMQARLADLQAKQSLEPAAYHVLNSFRPWWIAYQYLPQGQRPVDLGVTVRIFLLIASAGLTIIWCSLLPWPLRRRGDVAHRTIERGWWLGMAGLASFVVAAVALSSPGRIDVVDGHTRFEVGRSYYEHGDSIVRDPDAWFYVFSGRNGQRYSIYRFPQSVVAAAAILVSDLTGPVSEIRRHFFFSLSGAVLCAAMALLYAAWFRRSGHGRAASLAWAAGGILCTPTWFYGTTTFDDVLGSLVVLAAVFAAWAMRQCRPRCAAVVSGLLFGLAFNCKPPLVLFLPVAIAAFWDERPAERQRWLQARIALVCMAIGVIGYQAYDLWKFPPSTWQRLAEARNEGYVALWPGTPLAGFVSLLISPGMGAVWFWPASIVALVGVAVWRRDVGQAFQPDIECREFAGINELRQAGKPDLRQGSPKLLTLMTGLSCLAFLAFIGTISYFSGEPAWGPRYLTPAFALLWIFVPAGASRLRWPIAASLISVSLLIQVAGLSVDTLRFFCGENELAAEGFWKDSWNYFRLDRSQLVARSRQFYEVATYDGPPAKSFSPAKKPSLPLMIDLKAKEPLRAASYHVLSTFRPWWCSYWYLPAAERPVDLTFALKFLLIAGEIGAGLVLISVRSSMAHHKVTAETNGQEETATWAIAHRA